MRVISQVVISIVLGFAASTAHAQTTESWVIAGDGDMPNRELFVVDERSISDRSDLVGFLQTATPEQQATYHKQMRRKGKLKPGEVRVGPEQRVQIRVDEVFENPSRPNRITSDYQVNCGAALLPPRRFASSGATSGPSSWPTSRPMPRPALARRNC